MNNMNNRIPSLKNSKAVGQGERQKVKNSMNQTPGMSQMNFTNTMGNVPSLSSSKAVGPAEMQNVRQKLQQNRNKYPQNNGLR